MNSKERHYNRYVRRKQKRILKRQEKNKLYDNYDRLCTCNSLFDAAKMSRKSVRWKSSVQRYFMYYMSNIIKLRRKMINMQDVSMGFIEFTINERGKLRHIKSVHFKERVAQRSLCDNALVPVLSRTLIYDNGASIKNKGIKFTRDRLKQHLHEFYRKNGFSNDGYVLLMDFSGYFDNILHEPLYKILDSNFDDKRICKMTRFFYRSFWRKIIRNRKSSITNSCCNL